MGGGAQIYPIPHPHLEHRPIPLRPSSSPARMLITQLQQVPKDRHPGYLRQVLDLSHIGAVEVSDGEEQHGEYGNTNCLVAHAYFLKSKLDCYSCLFSDSWGIV